MEREGAILEQLKTAEEGPEKTEEAKNLLEQLISGIFEVVYRLTAVNISNLHILDTTFEETSDGKGAIVKSPITAKVNVNLPVLWEIVNLALNLVLQFSVGVETDGTGDCKVVVEGCGNDRHSTPLRVLGRSTGLLNKVVDFAVNLVNEVLSLVTHYEDPSAEVTNLVPIDEETEAHKDKPVLGENVVLALKLVLQSSVSIEPDKEPDIAKVVMEE
ncbi:short palate, lung and nasal epithelium carcinoma-associated protein 2A-like [Capricornis sumatraensis]|uniref:short palate, lung and nasal epithelium carcinoma-associated protein 2A-like n=1 Tax=Capricornis sumatraensis TaxID=34865 RepID=UPI00360479C4